MFLGEVRDAVCFKKKFDRAIQLAHPVEEVDVFDGMCGSDCSIEKMGSKRHFFDCVRICPIWSPIGKSPFSIHRSDCIRVGLTFLLFIFLLFVVFLAQFVVIFFVFSFSYPYVHLLLVVFCLFFFQAEDGIRDVERSRGLGDVYKRQVPRRVAVISGSSSIVAVKPASERL